MTIILSMTIYLMIEIFVYVTIKIDVLSTFLHKHNLTWMGGGGRVPHGGGRSHVGWFLNNVNLIDCSF